MKPNLANRNTFLLMLCLIGLGCNEQNVLTTSPTENTGLYDAHTTSDGTRVDLAVPEMRDDATAMMDMERVADTHPISMDSGTVNDGSTTDSMLDAQSADAQILDSLIADAETTPIPGPCPNSEGTTCADLCNNLLGCFQEGLCPVVASQDQIALNDACLRSCAFNQRTQEILCDSQEADCTVVFERLTMADPALETLCADEFSDDERQACTGICERVATCTDQMLSDALPPSLCQFQCLVQGASSVSECIGALPCNEQFEQHVQACLQGRILPPALDLTCPQLCQSIQSCEVASESALGNTSDTCPMRCAEQLTVPAAVACASLTPCELSEARIQSCEEENRDAPSCEMSCRRVLDCSRTANPFGVAPETLETCISNCETSSSALQRNCIYQIECSTTFLDDLSECNGR